MPRSVLLVALLATLAISACNKTDPLFGDGNPGDDTCKSNTDCVGATGGPVCERSGDTGTCVLCTATDHDACTGTKPVCTNHACEACRSDTDCGGGGAICIPTGACVAGVHVIHARSNATPGPGCGAVASECTLTDALMLADSTRNVIRLDDAGTFTAADGFTIANSVTIDARGATLERSTNGPVLTIRGGKLLTMYGGTIQNGRSGNGHGVDCAEKSSVSLEGTTVSLNEGTGISTKSCNLNVLGARVQDNSGEGIRCEVQEATFATATISIARTRLERNKKESISIDVDGSFIGTKLTIVGNLIMGNGSSTFAKPTVGITGAPNENNRLTFNTIAENLGVSGVGGIACSVAAFTARNNIIWNNATSVTQTTQTSGICLHAYSDISGAAVLGDGNTNSDSRLTADGHLQIGSAAIGAAQPGADLTGLAEFDLDNQKRLERADMGAYQFPR